MLQYGSCPLCMVQLLVCVCCFKSHTQYGNSVGTKSCRHCQLVTTGSALGLDVQLVCQLPGLDTFASLSGGVWSTLIL